MKLWIIWQEENNGYDTYDSAVVAAENEEAARLTLPSEYGTWGDRHPDWASTPDKVNVRLIGEALPEVVAGVVCASFNAG